MNTFKFVALIIATLSSAPAMADVHFTAAEKADHAAKVDIISQATADCLDRRWDEHVRFFKKYGVSKYYGNRVYNKGEVGSTYTEKNGTIKSLIPIRPELRKRKKDVNLENQMVESSCIDMARACLAEGFAAAGQSKYWQRIDDDNLAYNNLGHVIQNGLQHLGWKMLYWNPDPSQNEFFDIDDKAISPSNKLNVWGEHKKRYDSVMKNGTYWGGNHPLIVDDKTTLVGFKTRVPQKFLDVPYFFGIAHVGYHVFTGYYGNVIEGHSGRSIFKKNEVTGYNDSIENNMFNPLGGGAPMSTKSEHYRSGVIVVPPGYL